MRGGPLALLASRFKEARRTHSTQSRERIHVRCGSSGNVTIDLFNLDSHSHNSPLVIHLPSEPSNSDSIVARPPHFIRNWPVASINYRWGPHAKGKASDSDMAGGAPSGALGWPTPVHDTAFALAWIVENLAPPQNGRRDMYVYGSHLGAGLAASMALTGTHAHASFAIRGFAAYNGIYNWTMFLPDHRINRAASTAATYMPSQLGNTQLEELRQQLPTLFGAPLNLFDPFASPSLLFHSPGLLIPPTFSMSIADAAKVDAIVNSDNTSTDAIKQPRKSHFVFPPRASTLRIPETLLLHSPSPGSRVVRTRSSTRRSIRRGNTFDMQAMELSELMRRSIDVVELKERGKWDEDTDKWQGEARRRVQVVGLAQENPGLELDAGGQETALSWLRDRI